MSDPEYNLTLNADQARVIQMALELYSRVGAGQLGFLMEHPEIQKRTRAARLSVTELQVAIDGIKGAIYADMAPGQYYGIHSRELLDDTRSAWDLQQVIRHRMAWDQAGNPEKRDFNTMFQVFFDDPMAASKQPLARIAKVDGHVVAESLNPPSAKFVP
jgi:hypothetical protein